MKNVIFVSYSSGTPGVVTSEWAQDKIMGFEDLGLGVTLITSTMGSQMSTDSLEVVQVPSLSNEDFMQESGANWKVKGKRIGLLSNSLSATAKVLSFTLGRVFDALFVRLAGSRSDGRWSWFFYATPVTIWQVIRRPSAVIVSTGGPSVAHLVGLVSAKLTGRKFFCEVQDPLLGSEMQMSRRAKRVLLALEKSLARNASRLIFVTKAAANAARVRNLDYGSKIVSIYPGAYPYGIAHHENKSMHDQDKIVLVHLGHLYGSRNLDLLFLAIDQMIAVGEIPSGFIRIVNIGPAYVPNHKDYLAREDYQELPLGSRQDGLREATKADYLLLVQHSDTRSEETIPYKIYDYLNIGNPMFGLINNPELGELLEGRGFVGSSKDINLTKKAIREMVEFHRSLTTKPTPKASPFTLKTQVEKMLHGKIFT